MDGVSATKQFRPILTHLSALKSRRYCGARAPLGLADPNPGADAEGLAVVLEVQVEVAVGIGLHGRQSARGLQLRRVVVPFPGRRVPRPQGDEVDRDYSRRGRRLAHVVV